MHEIKVLLKKALDKGLFHLLGSNFLVQFLGFGLVLFLAGHLTPSEVGNFKLIHSYTAFFILIGCFGFNSSVLKFCSENIERREKSACFTHGMKRVVMLSVFSFIIMLLFNFFYFIPNRTVGSNWPYYYSFCVLFAPAALLIMAYMQSQKRVKLAAKLQVIVRLVFILLIFISVLLYGFIGVVLLTVASYALGLLIYLPFVKNDFSFRSEYKRHKELDKFSLTVFLGVLLTVLSQNMDIYLLGLFNVDSSLIGVYAVATLFFLSGTVITGTVQTIITPYFSEKQGDLSWVINKAAYYQKKLIYFSIVVAVGLLVGSSLLVNLYFGKEYDEAITIGYVLILKYFIWSCFCIYGAVLFSIGIVKEGIYISIIILIANVALSFLLFPYFNIYGVALAQVGVALLQMFLVLKLFNWKVKAQCLT